MAIRFPQKAPAGRDVWEYIAPRWGSTHFSIVQLPILCPSGAFSGYESGRILDYSCYHYKISTGHLQHNLSIGTRDWNRSTAEPKKEKENTFGLSAPKPAHQMNLYSADEPVWAFAWLEISINNFPGILLPGCSPY
jgi:hypothetical protein